jgi:hypothetical protein
MREYEEGFPVDANDRYYQGEHPGPDSRNSSNFGFANVKRDSVPGGNKVREDATAYLNERMKVMPYEESAVLFDQRVEFEAGEGNVFQYALPISDGDLVKVTWNGVEYECTAGIGVNGLAFFGNTGFVGGEDNGIPFAMATGTIGGQEMFGIIAPYFVGQTVSVKIEGNVIHTIDPKYLPESGAGFNVNVWYDSDAFEYVSDKTYEQIKAAEEAKTPIVGTFTLYDGKVFTMIGCDEALPTVNLVAFNLNCTPDIGVYHVSIDEDFTNVAFFSITATQADASVVYPK